jgi:hypothetical protein
LEILTNKKKRAAAEMAEKASAEEASIGVEPKTAEKKADAKPLSSLPKKKKNIGEEQLKSKKRIENEKLQAQQKMADGVEKQNKINAVGNKINAAQLLLNSGFATEEQKKKAIAMLADVLE